MRTTNQRTQKGGTVVTALRKPFAIFAALALLTMAAVPALAADPEPGPFYDR